jgi:hypothetical protein
MQQGATRGSPTRAPVLRAERPPSPTGLARVHATVEGTREAIAGLEEAGRSARLLEQDEFMRLWRQRAPAADPPVAFELRNGDLIVNQRVMREAAERAARAPAMALPRGVRRIFSSAEDAQDALVALRGRGDNPFPVASEGQLRRMWHRAGGEGDPPLGWESESGGLFLHPSLL